LGCGSLGGSFKGLGLQLDVPARPVPVVKPTPPELSRPAQSDDGKLLVDPAELAALQNYAIELEGALQKQELRYQLHIGVLETILGEVNRFLKGEWAQPKDPAKGDQGCAEKDSRKHVAAAVDVVKAAKQRTATRVGSVAAVVTWGKSTVPSGSVRKVTPAAGRWSPSAPPSATGA